MSYLPVFAVAFFVTLLTTPLARILAFRHRAIDQPDLRKVHTSPLPRWGGIAIWAGFFLSLLLAYLFVPRFKDALHPQSWQNLQGIFIASTIMLLVGVVDDRINLRAKAKLLFQIVAAVIAIFYGVKIEFITNPANGLYFLPDGVDVLVSLFWIVGIVNAINLLDGLDGLLAGVSTISALTLFVLTMQKGQIFASFLLLALAGASLGFLPHNFFPARIFMGDAGSLFLGMVWASVSIVGALKTPTVAVLVPVLILGLPIADTAIAILRRTLKKTSIFHADKEHLHHQLLKLGLNQKQAVLVIYGICGLLGALALTFSHFWR